MGPSVDMNFKCDVFFIGQHNQGCYEKSGEKVSSGLLSGIRILPWISSELDVYGRKILGKKI